jgi:hypothetical protein
VEQKDIAGRIQRLERLALGLQAEAWRFQDCVCPLLRDERWSYILALRGAASRLESARVILAKARQRLRRQAREG